MTTGLAYVGKIIALEPIENADRIELATVVCGAGGKWRGIVQKGKYKPLYQCIVYLPDAVIPECQEMQFMAATNWRVRMRRFRGAPSEVVIMPLEAVRNHPDAFLRGFNLCGMDVTEYLGVTKYLKPVPPSLAGLVEADFPGFVPKTDELHFQQVPEEIRKLVGHPYYMTLKCDGSSTTAFKHKGTFGVCSRNWEIKRDENNGYWKLALQHNLEQSLPDGVALQWESCGPGIQGNPMGLKELSAFAFSAYDIINKCYYEMGDFIGLCNAMKFPMAPILRMPLSFEYTSDDDLLLMAAGTYDNGKPREGIVIRSQTNLNGNHPVSFKVINLAYKD